MGKGGKCITHCPVSFSDTDNAPVTGPKLSILSSSDCPVFVPCLPICCMFL
jgi:hypothetical protein